MPFFISSRLAEELKFHLLKFAGTEDEVTGGNFIAERLTNLADTKRRLLTCRGHDIGEVDEDSLCGFGTQVVKARLVINGTKEGLKQARECFGFGPLTTNTTVGANYVFQRQGGFVNALLISQFFNELIFALTLVAVLALDERVGEGLDVSGCNPHLAGQDYRGVQPDDVCAAANHVVPPLAFDVLFEFHAQRAVVPGGASTAVNFTAGEDKAAALGKRDNGIKTRGGWLCHENSFIRAHRTWLAQWSVHILAGGCLGGLKSATRASNC